LALADGSVSVDESAAEVESAAAAPLAGLLGSGAVCPDLPVDVWVAAEREVETASLSAAIFYLGYSAS